MTGVVATRSYNPGDVIYSEEPFAKVLPREYKDAFCENCGGRALNLKTCKDCSAVKYCDKSCQKKDWSAHKLECALMSKLPSGPLEDFVRLLGRIILKLKGKNWKDIKMRIFDKDYSFDDIDSQYQFMTENQRLNLRCRESKELLKNYIGRENMPGDVDFIKILGKVKSSIFSVGKQEEKHFYIGINIFDKECIPSCDIRPNGSKLELLAIKKLEKGDKITVRRFQKVLQLDSFNPVTIERLPCKCADCSLPYGESVLSKILDETRAYSVIFETEVLLNAVVHIPPGLVSSTITRQVDALLCKQKGVLGKTNSLRLKLLALRCFHIGGPPWEIMDFLLELKQTMSEVFGEMYSECVPVYLVLSKVYMQMGNIVEGAYYDIMARNIMIN